MRYVIIRDDDTNALTPVECLERLYRPFLDRHLPINLAVIPAVATDTVLPNGEPEGFLFARNGTPPGNVSIATNRKLVEYLQSNTNFEVVQHGCHHDYFEFDRATESEIARRLDDGTRHLLDAGFPRPQTFVAPYDKLSRRSLQQVAGRFQVLSTGWFELRRLPATWLPRYCLKKLRQAPHWRVRNTILLTHPGCLLSCHRRCDTMLGEVIRAVNSRRLTVLVTHWWEYFRGGTPDEKFIDSLHATADYLASAPDIRVIRFSDLVTDKIPLN